MDDLFDDFPIVDDGRIIEPDGFLNAECKMQNAKCKMQNAQCGVRDAECGISDAESPEQETNAADSDTEILSEDEAEVISDYPDLSSDVDIEPKYQRFVDFYITCGNKKKAAKLAGFNAKNDDSLRVIASNAFKRPEVQQYYKLKKSEIAKMADIKYEAYMSELVSIATLDIADVVDTHLVGNTIENEPVYVVTFRDIKDIPEHARKAVKQIKINKDGSPEMIFYDKLQALKLLGEIKGYLSPDGGADDGEEKGIAMIPSVLPDEE